jgi:5-oxoprolinase (ATP-hydrolysing)
MARGKKSGWRIFVDRGGTFTDVVARSPEGRLVVRKLLSENPGRYPDAVLAGIREAAGLAPDAPLAGLDLEEVRIGTTVATNALLERRGARTALVVTRGFRDALRIGYQNRPRLFARHIVLPEPLYRRVIEVDERVGADGAILRPLDLDSARGALEAALAEGIESVAVAFLHGYRYPEHEREVAKLAREIGFAHVVASHEASPLIKFVARGDTAVADAYLTPVLGRYTERVIAELSGARLFFMQSSGGLAQAARFRGKDSILSGPAGGIVGAARVCEAAGFSRIIAFDMGGTSTDVSHYDGAFERDISTDVDGIRFQAPMLSIHTVAAGGGSKLVFDGARFRVGPGSAGADPGPACYRKGGPLTITDCNVMVGKIQPDFFPKVFGPDNDQPIDAETVHEKFAALAEEVRSAAGVARETAEIAEGFLTIAVQNMANAIKRVSIQRGRDVTRYTLCCFGGAGGQHACLVADALGMTQVFVPVMAGVLSALGLSLAEIRTVRQQSVERPLETLDENDVAALFDGLERVWAEELRGQGAREAAIARRVHVRYRGSDSALMLDYRDAAQVAREFAQAHAARFGFADAEVPLILATIEVEAVAAGGPAIEPAAIPAGAGKRRGGFGPIAHAEIFSGGAAHKAAVYARDDLAEGDRIEGPAIVAEQDATTVIEPGWRGDVLPRGHLLLTRVAERPRVPAAGTSADPVMLEVFNNFFMAIAGRMGAALAETAHSVNIKERLDFSCAIFDAEGGLVANAPHVPVHLGSMGESVRAVMQTHGATMRAGDSFALNAPYRGGTHLPDITVVTPVFDAPGRKVLFYVASRGHHADVGGTTPGSMPPGSRTIAEEGVLIDGLKIVEAGRFLDADVRAALGAGPWPARNPDLNVLDLKAQIAANTTGAREMSSLVDAYSLDTVRGYMRHVQDNAEESVRRVLDVIKDGAFSAQVDDGSHIRVRIAVDRNRREATIDFSGTSDQRSNNLNAPLAVTRAAVLYVFRTLVDDDIPLNEGCLKPLRIIAPEGSMLNPRYPAAVAAGNVETSQCVTDALFAALGAMAACQGTMNNFTFGDARFQYYETLCGGAGAGPGFDGASAVHTHMTNSRLTDPEILESRFPVVVEEFAIRAGSGGGGRWRGGDGAVRRIRFLAPMQASILSTRRKVAPFGLAGGLAGAPGRNYVLRADGRIEELPGTASVAMEPGDVFVVETPGGGGYGAAK